MNKKLVLLPTVISAAVMMGCSDSGSDAEPYVTEVIIKSHDGAMQDGRVLPLGYPTKLEATAVYNNGTHEDVTDKASWSNSAELSVEQGYSKGEFIAVDIGSARVTATFDGYQSSQDIQVQALEPTELLIEGRQLTFIDYPVSYKATTYFDRASHTITDFVEWEIDNSGVASIEGNTVSPSLIGDVVISTIDPYVTYTGYDAEFNLEIVDGTEDDVDFEISGSESIVVGATNQLLANVILRGDKNTPFDFTSRSEWSSSCPSAISVYKGLLTASQQVSDCTISAVYEDENSGARFEDHFQVASIEAKIEGLAVECGAEYFFGSVECKAYSYYENSDIKVDETNNVTWQLSSIGEMSIELGTVYSVDAGQKGTVSSWMHRGGEQFISNQIEVFVGLPNSNVTLSSERIVGGDTIIYPSGIVKIDATSIDNSGNTVDVSKAMSWSVEAEGWSVSDDGLVRAPNTIEDIVEVKATADFDGILVEEIIEITPKAIPVCDISEELFENECIHSSGELTGTPHISILKALDYEAYSGTSSVDEGFALFKHHAHTESGGEFERWCKLLNNINFENKSWELPNVDNLMWKDMSSHGWPISEYYWTDETSDRNTSYYIYKLDGANDKSEGNYTQAYYASCLAVE